jgi:hypothetical protein
VKTTPLVNGRLAGEPTVSAGIKVAKALLHNTPSISGIPKVDSKLTLKKGSITTKGVKVAYAWLVDGVKVSAKSSYTPKAADDGKTIQGQLTFSKSGYEPNMWASQQLIVAKGDAPKAKTAVKYSGSVKAGAKLKAKKVKWNQSKVSTVFTWVVDGTPVGTGSSYVVSKDDIGKNLNLVAVGKRAGHNDSVPKLSKTKKVPKANVSVSLKVPAQQVGTAGVATITVKAPAGIVPTGTVWVSSGKLRIGEVVLTEADNGVVQVPIAAFAKASTVKLVGNFSGDQLTNSKKSKTVKVKVKK